MPGPGEYDAHHTKVMHKSMPAYSYEHYMVINICYRLSGRPNELGKLSVPGPG